ncbi:MAG: hypothetical protein ABIP97_09745 [Chthoniobacterales bacterium]
MRFFTSIGCALVALCVLGVTPLKAQSLSPSNIGSLVKFLSNEKVRTTLNLTSSQRRQLDSQYSTLQRQVRTLVFTTPSNPTARAASEVKLKSIMKSSNSEAYSVLTKQQQAGLQKIEVKHLGGTLLLSDSIQKKLGVTPAQKAQIASIHAVTKTQNKNIHQLYQQGKISFREKIARFRTTRVNEAPKLLNVLTPAQRAAFTKLGS